MKIHEKSEKSMGWANSIERGDGGLLRHEINAWGLLNACRCCGLF